MLWIFPISFIYVIRCAINQLQLLFWVSCVMWKKKTHMQLSKRWQECFHLSMPSQYTCFAEHVVYSWLIQWWVWMTNKKSAFFSLWDFSVHVHVLQSKWCAGPVCSIHICRVWLDSFSYPDLEFLWCAICMHVLLSVFCICILCTFVSFCVLKLHSRVSLWTARQHHSICMLGLGFFFIIIIIMSFTANIDNENLMVVK